MTSSGKPSAERKFPELQQEGTLQRHGFQREVWVEKDTGYRLVLYRHPDPRIRVLFGAYIDEGDTLLYIMTRPKELEQDYRLKP